MKDYKQQIGRELDELMAEHQLSREYRRKKLFIWVVRTILTIVIYYFLWDYKWVRWTLVLYIPLSLFNLVGLIGFNYFARRKADKIRSRVKEDHSEE